MYKFNSPENNNSKKEHSNINYSNILNDNKQNIYSDSNNNSDYFNCIDEATKLYNNK